MERLTRVQRFTFWRDAPPLFLQGVVVLFGIGAAAFLLWEPHLEGRNAHATAFQVYFNDPFLAYVYAASIPFFGALYLAFKVLRYAALDRAFSRESLDALRRIKYCALSIIGLVAMGEIFLALNTSDDRAGGLFMGAIIGFSSSVVAAGAATLERILTHDRD